MRRFFAIAISVVLLLTMFFNISVYAASNTYDLDELELQVTIPSGYSVITRDTPASDPIFNDFGTTKSAIISQFQNSNIYLNAVSDTHNEEIVVTMTENSITNFSLLSDTVLNTFAATLANQYTDYGINVSKYEIYQHSQAKFIKVYFTDTANTVHGLQYYTIYDGKAINFTMRSYEGDNSFSQWSNIKTVVDSVKFNKAAPTSEPGQNTVSFIHTDTDSGVTFTVPENWEQKEFVKDRDFIDVKFVSTKDDGCIMIYGSTDMWEQMSASDRVGYTRSDLNNSAFTKSDIAEMYSTTADKITTITYNGVQYFKGENNYISDTYGVDITMTMTQLIYIDNGWMYMFQFGGTSTHKLYSDFESLLKSVRYPTDSNVGGTASINKTNSGSNSNTADSSRIVAVVVLVIVGIIVVTIIVSCKKNDAPSTLTNNKPIYNTSSPEPSGNTEATVSCKSCGQELPLDSVFCHKCGAKIEVKVEE